MLIDSHAHIELKEFDRDRDEVIRRAQEGGVECIVTVGIDLPDCRKAIAMAEKYEMVFATVPVRPNGNGQLLRADIDVPVNGSLESAGRRIALFGRLLDEYGHAGLPLAQEEKETQGDSARVAPAPDALAAHLGVPPVNKDSL